MLMASLQNPPSTHTEHKTHEKYFCPKHVIQSKPMKTIIIKDTPIAAAVGGY
jgi:hypothetical protein